MVSFHLRNTELVWTCDENEGRYYNNLSINQERETTGEGLERGGWTRAKESIQKRRWEKVDDVRNEGNETDRYSQDWKSVGTRRRM